MGPKQKKKLGMTLGLIVMVLVFFFFLQKTIIANGSLSENENVFFNFPKERETKSIFAEFLKRKYKYALERGGPQNFIIAQNIGGFGNSLNGMMSSVLYCVFADCLPLVDIGIGWYAPESNMLDLFKTVDPELKYYMDLKSPNNPFRKQVYNTLLSKTKTIERIDNDWFFECKQEMCKFLVEDKYIDIEDIIQKKKQYENNFREMFNFPTKEKKHAVLIYFGNQFLFEHLPRSKKKLEVLCNTFKLCYGNSGSIGFTETPEDYPKRNVYEEYKFYMSETEAERKTRFSSIPHPKIPETHSSATIRESYFGSQIFGSMFNELFELADVVENRFKKFWNEKIQGKFLIVLQMRQHYLPQDTYNDVYGNCVTNTLKRIVNDLVKENKKKKIEIALYLSSDKAVSDTMLKTYHEAINFIKTESIEKNEIQIDVEILESKDYFYKYFNPSKKEIKAFKEANFYNKEILPKSAAFREFIIWDFELFSKADLGISLTSSTYTLLSGGRNKQFFPPHLISIDRTWKKYMDDMRICHVTKTIES